jgi:hypothetical protein
MPAKPSDVFGILALISSYELRFGCYSTRCTPMDEDYNTMVLDIHFELMEKFSFSIPQILSLLPIAPPIMSSSLLLPLFIHNLP